MAKKYMNTRDVLTSEGKSDKTFIQLFEEQFTESIYTILVNPN